MSIEMEIDQSVDLTNNRCGFSVDRKRIILFNSFMDDGLILNYWKECSIKGGSNYIVLRNGVIHKLSSDDSFFKVTTKNVDSESITVCLDNLGYLSYNERENTIVDYMGRMYCEEDSDRNVYMTKFKWKGFDMWEPYTEEQLASSCFLVKKICDEFNIKKRVISHNTKIESPETLSGVMYRSNFARYYTDLSPAWDYQLFKDIIEGNENNDKRKGYHQDDDIEDSKREADNRRRKE